MKSFLFFLAFSTAIWILVQFSKVYTRVVEFPISYVNEPLDKIILEENPKFLKVRMTDNGFGILYYRLFKPTLNIDIAEAVERDQTLYYSIEENLANIVDQLGINLRRSEILKDVLVINYYQKMTKLLPVIPQISVEYKPGYGALEEIEIEPDSVKVSGHEQVVDTLQFVKTKTLKITDVSETIRGEVELAKKGLEDLSFYQDKVQYLLRVEKFTEGTVQIPIEVINVPPNVEISIFPQEATVVYQVNLDNYSKVSANDFRVVVDFKEITDSKEFLIPKIVAQPEVVRNLRMNVKKVEFVIIK